MAIKKTSTQKYLDIAEIKEDVVVLGDGTIRAVILCSSINFLLKNVEEQNALIVSYMQFLNSLDHPLQIVIQSRRLDIEGYLAKLKDLEKKQTNELLKQVTASYYDDISRLVELKNIMTKKFFIVVPYNPAEGGQQKNFWTRLNESFKIGKTIKLKRNKFLKYKEELDLRINNIQSRLKGMGLDTAVLDTQSLIELYYNIYNPQTSQNQKISDTNKLKLEQ